MYRVDVFLALGLNLMTIVERALVLKFNISLRRWQLVFLSFLFVWVLTACGTAPNQGAEAVSNATNTDSCRSSDNLLIDPMFTNDPAYGRSWRMVQHTGERSFDISVDAGTLKIERIAREPWMLYRQTVEAAKLSGVRLRYSAELKGDAPGEPMLHGFEHVAGLYIKAGREPARLADHQPNVDQWDWQAVTIEEQIPAGVTSVRVGFVHQAGGTLWARNPSLVIVDCD